MNNNKSNLTSQWRQHIAQTCARIMVEQQISDFQTAKQKAFTQLGLSNPVDLPNNQEIEAELLQYQRLFKAQRHQTHLRHLRQTAIQAMRLLAQFSPRLVGPALYGTATENTGVTLHLFAYAPEEVAFFLMEQDIPYQLSERSYRTARPVTYPTYEFVAGDTEIVLVVFDIDDIRWSPPSKLDGKPMRRATLSMVETLLAEMPND
jgi:hypothetical protein